MLWDCMRRIGVGGGGGRYSLRASNIYNVKRYDVMLRIGRNDEDSKTAPYAYRYTT